MTRDHAQYLQRQTSEPVSDERNGMLELFIEWATQPGQLSVGKSVFQIVGQYTRVRATVVAAWLLACLLRKFVWYHGLLRPYSV